MARPAEQVVWRCVGLGGPPRTRKPALHFPTTTHRRPQAQWRVSLSAGGGLPFLLLSPRLARQIALPRLSYRSFLLAGLGGRTTDAVVCSSKGILTCLAIFYCWSCLFTLPPPLPPPLPSPRSNKRIIYSMCRISACPSHLLRTRLQSVCDCLFHCLTSS